ncbi:thermonuclease family protein [Microvirga tunisiensis]|uniref:Thermonuclease family protein n=2 Tax=Microvirga tunisiensis TaxID=2108360 RepID=A0A5N7MK66_9HYPH|nr:thermonuclease family protein [Microvirga tunisiensis]MPR08847.1 thermonuclease family protein [Microvirga tunisiensis]MPR27030.1 thermonuclease family protein [Microvirga tunisiensis]
MSFLALLYAATLALALPPLAAAQAPAQAQPAFGIPKDGVTFETGDTWQQGSQRMRLYGVQACIRGTRFTNQAGASVDCGEASLSYLAAVIRDTSPSCVPVAQIAGAPATIIVVCTVQVGGQTLDLGTILISQGFAFASFSNDAKPVYMPYLVAELTAKQAKRGLWAASDLPHPNTLLFQSVAKKS